jgi:hypothetical protein
MLQEVQIYLCMPLKKQTNGAGAWSSGIILSGTLNNGSKFTLVNSSISSACYSTTQQTFLPLLPK